MKIRAGTTDTRHRVDLPLVERIDLNLLYVFDVVMVERHVTRAAERLDMTQPAVSGALTRLRRVFDDRLFVKTSRGVEPTPRAIALWPRIHQILEELRASVRPSSFDPGSAPCQFRVSLNDLSASLLVIHLHRIIRAKAPHSSLVLVPYDPALTEARLMRGDLDFSISIDSSRASVIESTPLWSAGWAVCGRPDHPLLESTPSLASFCAAPQLTVSESGDDAAASLVDMALKQRGLTRSIMLTVNQFSLVPEILKASDLLAVLPTRFATAAANRGFLATRPLPFTVPEAVVYLNWHKRSDALPAHLWMKHCVLEAASLLL